MPSIRLSRSGGSRSSGRCSASAPRRGLRTAPMSAGTAGLFSRKTPGTREPWTARRTRGRTSLSARSGRARRGGFRRRSGPGTWAASSSTSSRRWRPSERSERGGSPSASPWRISSPNDARRSAMGRRPRPRAPSPRPSAPATARTSAWTPRRRRAAEGRSVDFKRVSGPDPATDPAEYDDDYRAMLTAEEEALRARTALMQRDAELARARARERELAAALDLARRGRDDPRGRGRRRRRRRKTKRRGRLFPPRPRRLSPRPRRRRRPPNSTRSANSTCARSPRARRLRFASCRWRRGARWLDAARSLPPPRSTRRCGRRDPIGFTTTASIPGGRTRVSSSTSRTCRR